MMRRLLWPMVIALALTFIGWRHQQAPIFETDMLQLLPTWSSNAVVREARARVRQQGLSQTLFLLGAAEFEQAKQDAQTFAQTLQQSAIFDSVQASVPAPDWQALAQFYTPYSDRLLTAQEHEWLSNNAEQERNQLLQHWLNPVGLTLDNDPLGNVARFLQFQTQALNKLVWRDGVLTAQHDERYWVLVRAQAPDKIFDGDWQARASTAIAAAQDVVPRSELLWTGVFKFAQDSRISTTNEINWISSIGTISLLLAMWLVLRRWSPLILMFSVIASAMIGATALSLLVYDKLHLITYVFGATLIGIAGDYAMHYLVLHASSDHGWQARAAIRQLAKPLTIALLTTLLAYLAICLTPFDGFRQMAIFCIFGLLCAYLSVIVFLPWYMQKPVPRSARFLAFFARLHDRLQWPPSRTVKGLLLLSWLSLCVLGFYQLRADDDVHLLQRPSATLIAEQQRISAITKYSPASQFVLVQGDDAEQVLQREEALTGHLRQLQNAEQLLSYRAVSDWLPSAQLQQRNQQLLQSSVRDGVVAQTIAELGSDPLLIAASTAPITADTFFAQPFAALFSTQWLRVGDQFASVVLLDGVRDRHALQTLEQLPGVTFVDERAAISDLFARFRQQAMYLVVAAYALVALLLWWQRGAREMARRLLPAVIATTLTVALLGLIGVALNLFHGVALMLVLGIGVDYALFLADGEGHEPSSLLAIVLSALTAMMAFGLLSFSHLPAVAGFGLTVLMGVGLALLLAPTVFWWSENKHA